MLGITHYIDCRLCHYDKNKWSKRPIKDTFNQTLKLYPTKNLNDTIKKAFEIRKLKRVIKVLG